MEETHAIRGKTICIQLASFVVGFEGLICAVVEQLTDTKCEYPLNFRSSWRCKILFRKFNSMAMYDFHEFFRPLQLLRCLSDVLGWNYREALLQVSIFVFSKNNISIYPSRIKAFCPLVEIENEPDIIARKDWSRPEPR